MKLNAFRSNFGSLKVNKLSLTPPERGLFCLLANTVNLKTLNSLQIPNTFYVFIYLLSEY